MKNLILFVLCLLFVPSHAFAVAYTSTGSGDWDNVATWGGGGFPIAGDTATIATTHVVTVKGTEEVGSSPASIITYDLDITGTLEFENAAANSILNVYSSIRVNSGGKIEMGTLAAPMDCSGSARMSMKTSAAVQKYAIYLNGGTLVAHGCNTYHGTSATVTRARIASCSPDCLIGAARTITLDRTIGWVASTGWTGDGIIIGVGGNETTMLASGDDPEMITTWTAPASNQIAGVTFTENHMVGDIVVNVRRNILIDSDSVTVHPKIYTSNNFNDPYDMRYVRIDEFGDSTSANLCALNQASATYTLGTVDFVAITNAEDGGGVGCFYVGAKSWTSFEGNVCYDPSGRGYQFSAAINESTQQTILDCNVFGSANGNPNGMYVTASMRLLSDGFWCSHANPCIEQPNAILDITNSVIHGTTGNGMTLSTLDPEFRNTAIRITNNEIRNSLGGDLISINNPIIYLKGNDFDGAGNNCLKVVGQTSMRTKLYSYNNTFDRCNVDNLVSQGGVYIENHAARVYMNNESFGQTTANFRSNILWLAVQSTSQGGLFSGVCNGCVLAAPTNVLSCGSTMPNDGIFLVGCDTGTWTDAAYIDDECTFSLHNKDGVEDGHIGWGPGGMVFQRQTTVNYTTSNLKMQITPCHAIEYKYIKVGSVYINDATALTVDLYLRKDEAVATTGRRPRLALEGCGFDRIVDYDEMSDVSNTWEAVQVTGTSTWKGVVHIYVGVIGTLDGANDYQPTWPPTLDVYADGLVVTK